MLVSDWCVLDPYPLSLDIVVFVFGCFERRCPVSYLFHYPSPSNAFKFLFWILVGQLILLRDWKLVSSCKFVWLMLVSFWCIGGEGCLTDLFFGGWWTDHFYSRSEVSSLIQVCFGLIMVLFFSGSGVERWWKLCWNMTFTSVARLW